MAELNRWNGLAKPKYLVCGPLQKKVANPTLSYYPVDLASLIKNMLCFPRNSPFPELCVNVYDF